MSLVSEDSNTVKDNKPNQQTKAKLAKRYQRWHKTIHKQEGVSGEWFTDMDVDLLKSINERLANLDILDILQDDI